MLGEKPQLFYIHGGMTFNTKQNYINFLKKREISIERKVRWGDEYLRERLGKKLHIIQPRMPCKDNSKYEEWKIHFERHFPYLKDNIILIGTSLGGIFLAKYLSENKFPKKILSVYLICPPFDDTLPSEDLTADFELKSDLSLLEKSSKNIYLLFSKNDDVVPVSHAEKYRKKLKKANISIFNDKNGHFKVQEFPEIIKLINKNLKSIKNKNKKRKKLVLCKD
ncbi:MAG TPA: alpha/beta hydrolase [Candidatus Nanoarchaeia archaeon]|nr:alpha/beta hydrolase [Candidatus Nanoarchaeia archaeon]